MNRKRKSIGIIANPASGKDIRRMIAYGSAFDNSDKVNIVRRIILSASSAGVDTVYYMKEYYGIVECAVSGIYNEHKHYINSMKFEPVDITVLGIELDTTMSAEKMRDVGVSCIIVLGGDGTNRAVAKGCGDIPLIPISTGTNNVFPKFTEGTIAGLAAGAYASEKLPLSVNHVLKTKRLEICKDSEIFDIALIDAVFLADQHVGARAVWTTDAISQVFLTSCSIENIGISAIGGQLKEVGESEKIGLYVEASKDGNVVQFPMAPGLMQKIGILNYRLMNIGEEIPLKAGGGVIAVDGEREINVSVKENISIRLTWNGPRILNIRQILSDARNKHLFYE